MRAGQTIEPGRSGDKWVNTRSGCANDLRTEVAMHLALRKRLIVGTLAVLVVALAAVAGCTMVGDVTGVDLQGAGPTTCVKQCNDYYKFLYNHEQKRHDSVNDLCNALPQPEKGNCLVEEDARNQANKAEPKQAKIDCQNNCHRQGSGTAG